MHKTKLTPAKIVWMLVTILVICCIFLSFFETPLGWQVDLTPDKIYTLFPETENLLSELEDDITIYTLYSLGNYNKVIMTLLDRYTTCCDKITISNIDPTSDRLTLKKFEEINVEVNDGSLVVLDNQTERFRVIDVGELYQQDQDETYFFAENSITSAIHYAVTGEFQRIFFMTGHRETDMNELKGFVSKYKLRNYLIEEYDYLRTDDTLSPKTDILISVSPREDFSETEADNILEYIREGGTFLLLYDNAVYNESLGAIEFCENEMPNLFELLNTLGIAVREGIISGKNASETGFRNTILELESPDGAQQIVFSECAPLTSVYALEANVTSLLHTLSDCVLQNSSYAANGPFSVAMMSELEKGRAVVFSTSSFISDTEFAIGDNGTFLDSILYESLPGQPAVALEAKRANTDELFINSILVKTMLILAVLLVIPGGILILGIYILRRRKEKSELTP